MPTISITVPTEKAKKVYDAFKAAYGHDIENPSSADKLAFVKEKLVSYVKEVVHAQDVNVAATTAKDAVVKDDTVIS